MRKPVSTKERAGLERKNGSCECTLCSLLQNLGGLRSCGRTCGAEEQDKLYEYVWGVRVGVVFVEDLEGRVVHTEAI